MLEEGEALFSDGGKGVELEPSQREAVHFAALSRLEAFPSRNEPSAAAQPRSP